MMKNIQELYNQHHDDITHTDAAIFNFIVQKPRVVTSHSIQQLAQLIAVSQSSIVRFTQKIGLSGFSELKYIISNSIAETVSEDQAEALSSDKIIDLLGATKKSLEQTNLTPVLNEIYHARRIFCYGTGMAQRNVLAEFRRNLLNANKFTIEVSGISELENVANMASESDLVIVVSLSGKILEIKGLLQVIQARGGKLIGVTQMSNNNLATIADYNLYFNTDEEIYDAISVTSFLPAHLVLELVYRAYLKQAHGLNKESGMNENKTNNNE